MNKKVYIIVSILEPFSKPYGKYRIDEIFTNVYQTKEKAMSSLIEFVNEDRKEKRPETEIISELWKKGCVLSSGWYYEIRETDIL